MDITISAIPWINCASVKSNELRKASQPAINTIKIARFNGGKYEFLSKPKFFWNGLLLKSIEIVGYNTQKVGSPK
mgnify:FL=1